MALKIQYLYFVILLKIFLLAGYFLCNKIHIKNISLHSSSKEGEHFFLPEFDTKNFPNIPRFYLDDVPVPFGVNKTCAKFPSIFDLDFNNFYWQSLQVGSVSFQLLNAYLDVRLKRKFVRILGMINSLDPGGETFCQLWFEDYKKPFIVKTDPYQYIWLKDFGYQIPGTYQPYLVSCPIPKEVEGIPPASVSLVSTPCQNPKNNLRVIFNFSKDQKDFAICVKGLDFLHEDLSLRLVEWMELQKILGVEKIFFYELQAHPNIRKILQEYEERGFVNLSPLTLPGGLPNVHVLQHEFLQTHKGAKRVNEIIPYNDCFYQNIYRFKYVILLDVDEVIMPKTVGSLQELILALNSTEGVEKVDFLRVLNTYFLDEFLEGRESTENVPLKLHMLKHVYRTRKHNKPTEYIKSIFNTNTVKTLHNHFPFSCLGGKCTSRTVDFELGQLQHYRGDCVSDFEGCDDFKKDVVRDDNIMRFKDVLVERVGRTLDKLGLDYVDQ